MQGLCGRRYLIICFGCRWFSAHFFHSKSKSKYVAACAIRLTHRSLSFACLYKLCCAVSDSLHHLCFIVIAVCCSCLFVVSLNESSVFVVFVNSLCFGDI